MSERALGRAKLKQAQAAEEAAARCVVSPQSALDEANSIVSEAAALSREAVVERLRELSGKLITAANRAMDDLGGGNITFGQARVFETTVEGVANAIETVRLIHGL